LSIVVTVPHNYENCYILAEGLEKQGNWEYVIEGSKLAIKMNPNNAKAHGMWGYALLEQSTNTKLPDNLKLAKLDEAIEHFKKARDLFRAQGETEKADGIDRFLRKAGWE
jgi:tetratricopeptide (TPR) repeat protein